MVGDMKMLARLLVAMAMFFFASGAALSAGEPIGKVLSAAEILRASGKAGTRVLSKKDNIFFLDRISTNSTGVGEFEFMGYWNALLDLAKVECLGIPFENSDIRRDCSCSCSLLAIANPGHGDHHQKKE